MSILTGMGKVNDIFVNHDGIKKPVLSGWVSQNGVVVPFYRKGYGGKAVRVIWSPSPWNGGGMLYFKPAQLKAIVVSGTISMRKYSSSGATATQTLSAIVPLASGGNKTVQIAQVQSGSTTQINNVDLFEGLEVTQNEETTGYLNYPAISSQIPTAAIIVDFYPIGDELYLKNSYSGRNGMNQRYANSGLSFQSPDKLGAISAVGTIYIYSSGSGNATNTYTVGATAKEAASSTTLRTFSAAYKKTGSTSVTTQINVADINNIDWTQYDAEKGLFTAANGSSTSYSGQTVSITLNVEHKIAC